MSPAELHERLKSASPPRLLDVREPDEFAYVALPGATLIPLGELPARWPELESWKEAEVVVYCHHGIRSLHGIHILEQSGFKRLHNLTGGIDAWSREIDASAPRY